MRVKEDGIYDLLKLPECFDDKSEMDEIGEDNNQFVGSGEYLTKSLESCLLNNFLFHYVFILCVVIFPRLQPIGF